MKIYLLERVGQSERPYDQNESHVVIASTPAQARQLCAAEAADEGASVWLDHLKTTCRVLKATGNARVVMTRHYAG